LSAWTEIDKKFVGDQPLRRAEVGKLSEQDAVAATPAVSPVAPQVSPARRGRPEQP